MARSDPSKIDLTKRRVEAIELPSTGERIVWDERLTGFAVRVSSTGRRTYFIQRRTDAGRQIKLKIGVHGNITAEQARKNAERELGKLATGSDPAEARNHARAEEAKRLATPTVAELCDRYLIEHAKRHKRPRSVAEDESMIRRYVKPFLGAKRVTEVKRGDIAALHRSIEGKYAANRVLSLVSKLFSLATVDWELRPDNPARGIKRNAEQPRERFLDDDELERLTTALAKHSNQVAANAVRLLLLTGARRGEVLSATWDEFDLTEGVWTKPSAHTKQARTHRIPLSGPARALLAGMRVAQDRGGSPYVFPAQRGGTGPTVEIKASWVAICRAADLQGVRIHDLRHTYASALAGAGEGLPMIGALLGHTNTETTRRYTHLVDSAMRGATERVGAKLGTLVGEPAAPAEVIPLRQGSR